MTGTEQTDTARRRKLMFRAGRRGFLEMDLLIGGFAQTYLHRFDCAELDAFEALLDMPDWDVYAWALGRADPPAGHCGPVMDLLRSFRLRDHRSA